MIIGMGGLKGNAPSPATTPESAVTSWRSSCTFILRKGYLGKKICVASSFHCQSVLVL